MMNKNQLICKTVEYDILLEYMKRLSILEKAKYEQDILYRKLEHQRVRLKKGNAKAYIPYQNSFVTTDPPFLTGGILSSIAAIICFIVLGYYISSFFIGILISIGVWFLSYFLIFLIYTEIGDAIKRAEMNKKNDEIKKKNTEIETENKAIRAKELKQLSIIMQEQDRVYNLYKETENALNSLYDLNIVYFKYQNMVAIFTLYEYLLSKRCYQLEGPNGAYNIYENELRQGIIINKLDVIIQKLDTIIENQRLLSQEISISNRIANKMSNQIVDMAKKLGAISQSTEISAYYNRITAQNTEYLKWADFIKTTIN